MATVVNVRVYPVSSAVEQDTDLVSPPPRHGRELLAWLEQRRTRATEFPAVIEAMCLASSHEEAIRLAFVPGELAIHALELAYGPALTEPDRQNYCRIYALDGTVRLPLLGEAQAISCFVACFCQYPRLLKDPPLQQNEER
jgi:hypothetical protein